MKSNIKGNHEPGNYTPDTTIFTDISLQNYDLPDQITQSMILQEKSLEKPQVI